MQFIVKLLISISIISVCVLIGRRYPTLSGLIATMPLTGVIVLVWLYTENRDNSVLLQEYTKGALWGILPSILFFIVEYICFSKQVPLFVVLCASFGVWFLGAIVHQWLLG